MAELKEITELERISAHSHIYGLGLDENGKAKRKADGLVGQVKAREAAGIVVEMIKSGKFAGNAILLAGPPGSGKTALATAIARELGEDVPFVPIAGSEIYSAEVKKTEFLTQALRKAIGVRIREIRKIYEGKVEEIDIEWTQHPYNPYQRIPAGATVKLVTTDENKKLKMDSSFAMQLVQQGISAGDVIQIDIERQRLSKIGTTKKNEYDLSTAHIVEVPEGSIIKEKEFVYTPTLHDLDVVNSRSGVDFFSLFFGSGERKEIDESVRREVDRQVKKWIEDGMAELIPGVLFIDEASMLDIEVFAFLNRAMEQELSPIIIFATNRGITRIRGTDIKSPHGMPLDLLDRLLVITTHKYPADEIRDIILIRAQKEGINIGDEALSKLVEIGEERSLRYAIQLLVPAWRLARRRKSETIEREDVEKAFELFVDVKRSVEYLREMEKEMMVD